MVTLEEAKTHLRVSAYVPGEDGEMVPYADPEIDGEVQRMIDAAVSHLESINVDLTVDPLPPALRQAILMLVAHFYDNRTAAYAEKVYVIPLGVARLIAPFRKVSL